MQGKFSLGTGLQSSAASQPLPQAPEAWEHSFGLMLLGTHTPHTHPTSICKPLQEDCAAHTHTIYSGALFIVVLAPEALSSEDTPSLKLAHLEKFPLHTCSSCSTRSPRSSSCTSHIRCTMCEACLMLLCTACAPPAPRGGTSRRCLYSRRSCGSVGPNDSASTARCYALE